MDDIRGTNEDTARRDTRVDTSAKPAASHLVSPLSDLASSPLSSNVSAAAGGVFADIFHPLATAQFTSSSNVASQPVSNLVRQPQTSSASSTQSSRQQQSSGQTFAILARHPFSQKPGSTSVLKPGPVASGSILGTGSMLAARPENFRKNCGSSNGGSGSNSTTTLLNQRNQQPKAQNTARPLFQQQPSFDNNRDPGSNTSNAGNSGNSNSSTNSNNRNFKNNESRPTIGRVNMVFKRD